MRTAGKIQKILQIKELVRVDPELLQRFWLIENNTLYLYTPHGWKKSVMNNLGKVGKNDFLIVEDCKEEFEKSFRGHIITTPSIKAMQVFWESCLMTDEEIRTKTKEYSNYTIRGFADEIVKLFNNQIPLRKC